MDSANPSRNGPACPPARTGRRHRPHGGRRFGRRPRRRRPARRRGPTPPTLLGLGGADAPGGRARRVGLPALGRSPTSHRRRARRRCRARNPRPPWAGAGPRPPGPAPPQPDHAAATGSPPAGGQAGLSRSAQSAPPSTANAARAAAVCAAHAALDDAPCPGSRIAAGAGSEPGGLGSREGFGAGGSTTLGSFRGFWIPAVWGRVMRTGVNVAYGP